MMKYVIYQIADKLDEGVTESGMSSLAQWADHPEIRLDVNGHLMAVVREFEAADWNEAMQVYYDHYGYGKYKPLES